MRCRAHFSLMIFLIALSSPLSAQTIELEINNTNTETDDYIGWTPIRCQVKLVGGTADLSVTLESTKRTTGSFQGEVWFAAFTTAPLTPSTFSPLDSLPITLPMSGAWKGFWVAGKESSSDGKDVKIVVKDAMGTVRKEVPLMVRVRKNAESLSKDERDRFLQALATLHDVDNDGANSKYYKYVKAHSDGFDYGIHYTPSFPSWHRAYLLSLERELQAIDPRVALPYWKFDEPAPKLFSREFMGVVTNLSSLVQFSNNNPIRKWKMPSATVIDGSADIVPIPLSTQRIIRARNASAAGDIPVVDITSVSGASGYTSMRTGLENDYHGSAHNHISGWLASGSSPRDPLFFLLHANVDRAWASWQRDDVVRATQYFPLGSYTPGGEHYGNYGNDTVWPFNGKKGDQGTSDTGDDWPGFAFIMPPAMPHHGPGALVLDLMDSLVVSGIGQPHGAYYDHIRFK
jgi:tyrosinase